MNVRPVCIKILLDPKCFIDILRKNIEGMQVCVIESSVSSLFKKLSERTIKDYAEVFDRDTQCLLRWMEKKTLLMAADKGLICVI